MPLCSDVESVLGLLDQMQTKMKAGGGVGVGGSPLEDDPRIVSQVNDEINTLLSVLTNPMFQRICKIKDSMNELGDQMIRHPSITTNDFDITPEGSLVVKISPPAERYKATFDTTMPLSLDKKLGKVGKGPVSPTPAQYNGEVLPITTPTYEEEFERVLKQQAQGRQVHKIGLFKPEGGSLGFSVVGLKSQEKGELGIFVQELQPNGIAARDGRLQEGDQILAIDGQPLDSAITHQQAIGILQQSRGEVEIVIARAPDSAQLSPTSGEPIGTGASAGGVGLHQAPLGDRPTSASSNNTDSKLTAEMVLNTEWAQVEVIELINDGTGLGFGIIGGRSTGVVVKTILPGGVADRDGRLQSGDHILQIGDVNLLGMGSEQVAAVLRQCGSCVRLVVARPIEPTSPDALSSHAPIVPTRILGDPDELERHLIQSNGYNGNNYGMMEGSMMGDSQGGMSPMENPLLGEDGMMMVEQGELSPSEGGAIISGQVQPPFDTLPEVEIVDVELHKDSHGLGITIAGYVCEKEELSGIFVKSISEGSAADLSKRIQINDRIVEVDGQSLQGFNNHEAVEVLRKTGSVVMLKLERYHHGSKYDQLQSAISHSSEHKPPTPSSVSALSLPQVPVDSDNEELAITPGIEEDEEEEEEEEEEEDEELIVETTTRNEDMDLEDLELLIDTRYEGEILATVEAAIMAKWSKIMGPDVEVVVSQLSKAKEGGGLGISLEGTVDVEDGREVRPHHYIRNILSDGPVGRAGMLQSGDELLEVNGRRLLGLNHVEVVSILKDLPMHVRLVCARRPGQPPPSRPIDTAQDRNAFAARNILGGSLQNLFQNQDRLVKAKSDGSLASTGTTNATTDNSLSKLKSRSLEPLTGLAMWSPEPHIIELPKGERGLGFSILDYQDPMNPSETVIVIRSLVPGGVAQQDGRLIPGDRLLAVNDTNLENASLDQAVQALKGAPRGIVRIIVAKPLPLPDHHTGTTTTSNTTAISTAPPSQDVTPPPLPLSPPPELESLLASVSAAAAAKTSKTSSPISSTEISVVAAKQPSPPSSASRTPPERERPLPYALSQEDSSVSPPPPKASTPLGSPPPPVSAPLPPLPPVVPPPPPMTELDLLGSQNQVPGLIVPVATERLISSASFGRSTSLEGDLVDGSTYHSILPPALERTVKVKKQEEPLGINVELVDEGRNGVMVTSVAIGGPFARDGRIHAGDYLVAINNESLRNVTNAQARAILRRAQLFSKDLSVSYIPATDAEVHRQSLLIQQSALKQELPASSTAAAVTSPPQQAPSEETNREVGEESVPQSKAEQRSAEAVRTPADGQEALPEDKPATTTTATTTAPVATPAPVKVATSVSRAPIPYSRSSGPPPPVPAKPGSLVSSLAPATTETSTVFINTSEIPVPQATQPTVQKRVVTHVTIFPSPPPDIVSQVSRVQTVPTSRVKEPVGVKSPVSPVVSPTSSSTEPAPPPPPPPLPQEKEKAEQEPSSVASEPDLEPASDISEPSAQVGSAGASVVKSEPEVSLQQSSSLEMVNKTGEPLSSTSEKDLSASAIAQSPTTVKGGGGGGGGSSGDESSALLLAKHWGPERLVQVPREPGKSLGISIVGGKVDLYNAGPDSGSAISGIFIKNVLLNSPAGRTGQLKTGDRILSVDDVDLRSASHERAVEVIRAAGNPVRFLVQSLVHWSDGMGVSIGSHEDSEPSERSEGTERTHTQSQSYSQTVHSTQSCSSATTDTCTGTCTASTTGTSRTETNGRGSGSEESTSLTPSLSHTTIAKGETPEGLVEEDEDEEEDDQPGEGDEDADDDDDGHCSEVENAFLRPGSPDEGLGRTAPSPVTPARSPSPEVIQQGLGDEEKQVMQASMEAATKKETTPAPPVPPLAGSSPDEESAHSSEEDDELGDDERQLQGKIRTKAGIEIDRASAGHVRRSKDYNPAKDEEPEDEFGYTLKKIQKRWGELAKSYGVKDGQASAKLVVADLERTSQGLGISLAGHRDRLKMATYVCGINPAGIAHKTKALEVGDEILEVNGLVIHGRCHLNASAIIKSVPHSHVKFVALRKPTGLEELSVKPLVQFPVSLKSESPEEKYASYKGLRVVNLKKGPMGLGIMIMEGRHAELGQGIFISDIQEGSVAEQAGLFVGDMILAVNGEDMVGADYDHAANTLKKTEGNVSIVVCNASKGDEGPTARRLSAIELKPEPGQAPPPPKEMEKPKLPPKPSKIPSPSKLLSSVISSRVKTSPTPTPAISPSLAPIPISTIPTPALTSAVTVTHGPVPSVIVKPATPSPKMPLASVVHQQQRVHHPTPHPPPNKLNITMKPRASSIGSDTGEPPQDPTSCEIKPGRETTIEINKDKMGLGLSIVGGSDTLLGSIIIHEVYADGAAAKDGRLRPGDQLLSVNQEDFQNISHTKALAALRQTPTKVRMVVYRDEAIVKEDDMYDIQDVELVKKSGKGLGLSIVGRKNGTGVFISDVVPGGIAELHGGLMKGDMIISVNGHDLKSASQEEAAAVLKTVIGPIRMRIARLKAAASRSKSSASTPATVPATPTSDTNVDVELEEGAVDDDLDLIEDELEGDVEEDLEDDDLSYVEKPSSISSVPPLLPSTSARHNHNSTTITTSGPVKEKDISTQTPAPTTTIKIPSSVANLFTSTSTLSLSTSMNSITGAVSVSSSVSSLEPEPISTPIATAPPPPPPPQQPQSQIVSVSAPGPVTKTAIVAKTRASSANGNNSNGNESSSGGPVSNKNGGNKGEGKSEEECPSQVRHIVLERGQDGLGFSIVGGHGSPHGNLPIYVKTVFDKGAAVNSGLKRGDQILAVNKIICKGLTHQEAVALLKNVKGSVNLTILS